MDTFFQNKTFIVTDDSESQRKRMRLIGEKLGMKYQGEASDGLECLKKLEQKKSDFLFLDILMPQMHGFEVMEILQAEKSPTLIIIMTALTRLEVYMKEKHLNPPFLVLNKELTFEQIFAKLKKAAEQKEDDDAANGLP